ncbi:GNAT family N-acetyltransferase [Streptomyces sp. NPDC050204]|uniref:GNAT family N-acetyltransferase n=1 Tax=Streptomyces sp. NPDC050204 TaxID=3155514 RepID=UPI00342DD957
MSAVVSKTTRDETLSEWFADVSAAPDDTLPALHPFRTRAWAWAWTRQNTERILEHRHLTVTDHDTGVRETISFLLVPGDGSPYWNSQESDAGVAPVWPGPVLWAGSPHAEYGGAGTATPAITRVLLGAGRELAHETGACALAMPGLRAEQAARVAEAGGAEVLSLPTDVSFTRYLGTSHDAWWAAIPAAYRREARRQWRRGSEEGLTLQVHHGPDARPALRETFHALAEQTAKRHGSPLYGDDMFHHLADVPGAVLLSAHNDDQFVGGIFGWLHQRGLYLWASGIDYDHPLAPRSYTWLMGEVARWAINHGATHIDAGRWNCRAKTRLGYKPHVLHTAVHLMKPDPGTAQRLKHLSGRLGDHAAPFLGPSLRW